MTQITNDIFNAQFDTTNVIFNCEYLEKHKTDSILGNFSYILAIICPKEKNVQRKSKILITGIANILNTFKKGYLYKGIIIYSNLSTTTIKTDNYIKEYQNTLKFTLLLQKIVSTIDEKGLKQAFLKKHIKSADKFLNEVITSKYKTEVAIHYQIRIQKYKDNLFEFLIHNSVSWNNSNAEHAIRLLANHVNKNINAFRETRINDYLKIFSIYQTCDFKNISFLKFLLSKHTSIESYIKTLKNN